MNFREAWDVADPARNWPLGNISLPQYDDVKATVTTVPKDRLSAPPVSLELSDWDGNLSLRRIDIKAGGLTIECFGTPSEEKKLFVFLSSGKGRRGEPKTLFERVSWHPWLNGVCLNIDDSTRKWLDPVISAGWYIGSRKTHALPIVADIVSKAQAHYGIANEDVNFIGSSTGGFAALWLADVTSGATAIAGHPPQGSSHGFRQNCDENGPIPVRGAGHFDAIIVPPKNHAGVPGAVEGC